MLDYLDSFLRENSPALLFLMLGLGYLVGRIKIRGFQMGPVSGVLLTGLVFGHFGYTFSGATQIIGFVLFIFCVGLQAGPSFFNVLRQEGLRYIALALIIGVIGFTLAVVLGKVLDLEPGAAGGLLAGGMTSSPTLAAAQEAVRTGQVSAPDGMTSDEMMTNVATGYAITYIFGLLGLIMLLNLLPKLMRIDLPAEAARLEAAGDRGGLEDRTTPVEDLSVRAYRVTGERLVGKTIRELQDAYPGRVSIEKLRRAGEFIEPTLDTRFEHGDEVCMTGYLDAFLERAHNVGPELSDRELLDTGNNSCRIVVLRGKVKGRTATAADAVRYFGCFVSRIQRMGVDLPVDGTFVLRPGDVVHATGPPGRLKQLGGQLGHIERATEKTDLITFGLGIAAGLLVGSLTVAIGGVSIGLGTAGGLLTVGLVLGYLRALRPTFGQLPDSARWVFMELGLLVFMAGVGLRAGSSILETLVETGPKLVLAGVIVTSVPVLVGAFIGLKILKIHPVMLMGAITGSMTSGASLSIVTGLARSPLPALGYAGAYAFANILLTIAGSIILLF